MSPPTSLPISITATHLLILCLSQQSPDPCTHRRRRGARPPGCRTRADSCRCDNRARAFRSRACPIPLAVVPSPGPGSLGPPRSETSARGSSRKKADYSNLSCLTERKTEGCDSGSRRHSIAAIPIAPLHPPAIPIAPLKEGLVERAELPKRRQHPRLQEARRRPISSESFFSDRRRRDRPGPQRRDRGGRRSGRSRGWDASAPGCGPEPPHAALADSHGRDPSREAASAFSSDPFRVSSGPFEDPSAVRPPAIPIAPLQLHRILAEAQRSLHLLLDAPNLVLERLDLVRARPDAERGAHARYAHVVQHLVAPPHGGEHLIPVAFDVRAVGV